MASNHSTVEVHPLLSEDAFQNDDSRKMFDAIDKMQSVGANRDIGLPELVIVGDQSAGKSSLLQSLTDIPFPVAGNICTRFPTRIISRRTTEAAQTTISIDPSGFSVFGNFDVHDTRKARYEGFKRTFVTMTKTDFMKAVDEATELMRVVRTSTKESTPVKSDDTSENEYQNFSDDVLKIEISGPDRSHFSILDVPGVFQSLTKNLTEKDKTGVNSMVSGYMASQQSVIICVASGTNDVANQSIFDKASIWDMKGERTIGVITKCDASQHVNQIMDLAENKEKNLHHGWFVVRNRTPDEVERGTGALDRFDKEQAFFSAEPWNRLKEDRRGTQALKRYLAKILCGRIQKTFPSLLEDIQKARDSTAAELKAMGVSRKTVERKRTYLTKIAQDFHFLASETLKGRYENTEGNSMRLRMKIFHANSAFANDMKRSGHSVPFAELSSSSREVDPWTQFASNASTNNSDKAPAPRQPSPGGGLFASSPQVGPPSPFASNASTNNSDKAPAPRQPSLLFAPSPQPSKVRLFCPPTSEQPFRPYVEENENSITNFYQSIPFMPPYKKYSFEELRLNDGAQAQTKAAPVSAFGGIGVAPEKPSPTLFGRGSATAEKPNLGGFGGGSGNPPSLFSQSKQTSSAFSFRDSPAQTPSVIPPNNHNKQIPNDIFSIQANTVKQTTLEIYRWIKDEIKSSRGTELQGTMNPDVLPILFHKQARNWKAISEGHLFAVSSFTYSALAGVLQTVCSDVLTRSKIDHLIFQANQESKSRGSARLIARIEKVLSGHLQTNSSAFEEKVSEARRIRFHAALERYRLFQGSQRGPRIDGVNLDLPTENQLVIDMRDTASLFAELHMSNSQNLEDEIHDTLKAYYDVARDHFVEHVNQEVVEPYLDDAEGPVFRFSPIYVAGLKDESIEDLAAEDLGLVRKRAEAEDKLARLNRAEEIALEYNSGGVVAHS